MTRERTAFTVSRYWPLVSALVAIFAVLGLGAVIAFRRSPLEADTEWMDEILKIRNPVGESLAQVFNFLGGGWFAVAVVPLLTLGLFCLARRYWAAVFAAIAVIASAGAVRVLKNLFGRARPQEMLVTSDFGSFPSGHVANAVTISVVLGLALRLGWVWVAGAVYTVLMMLSRTYLGAHWLSDTFGGLLLGAAVAVIVWTPLATKLAGELQAPSGKKRSP